MIKNIFFSIFLIFCLFLHTAFAEHAFRTIHSVTMVNHFSSALSFEVMINPEMLPDMPQETGARLFLQQGEQKTSKFIEMPPQQTEVYVLTLPFPTQEGKGLFWALSKDSLHLELQHGIAYSGSFSGPLYDSNLRIIFCTVEAFNKDHVCQ